MQAPALPGELNRIANLKSLNNSQSIENERNRIYDVVNQGSFGQNNLTVNTSQNLLYETGNSPS